MMLHKPVLVCILFCLLYLENFSLNKLYLPSEYTNINIIKINFISSPEYMVLRMSVCEKNVRTIILDWKTKSIATYINSSV